MLSIGFSRKQSEEHAWSSFTFFQLAWSNETVQQLLPSFIHFKNVARKWLVKWTQCIVRVVFVTESLTHTAFRTAKICPWIPRKPLIPFSKTANLHKNHSVVSCAKLCTAEWLLDVIGFPTRYYPIRATSEEGWVNSAISLAASSRSSRLFAARPNAFTYSLIPRR